MLLDTIIKSATQEFKQKMQHFCQNIEMEHLTPALSARIGECLKSALSSAGLAGYKAFLESFEDDRNSLIHNDRSFRYTRVSQKKYLTLFGELNLGRRIYYSEDTKESHIPLESHWGMVDEYMTPEVRESVLFSCAHITPEESSTLLSKCSLFCPSPTAIKHVVSETGRLIESEREKFNNLIRQQEDIPAETKAVAVSLDGVNVLLNEPGIRKGKKPQRPQIGEQANDKTSYRNAMVGSISFYAKKKKGEKHPVRLGSRYTARMPEFKFTTFKEDYEAEVSDTFSNLPAGTKKILLIDGHHSIRGYVDGHPLYSDCEHLIDFYHCVEHVSKASEAIFGKSSTAGKRWYWKWYRKLLKTTDGANEVFRSMKYYYQKIPKSRRKLLLSEISYFKRHRHKMNYAYFVKRKMPIGTGPVEAACKSIVKQRLCRSGMRWSRTGGQNVLHLRTYVKSNRWDAFWNEYKIMKKCA